MKPSAVLAALRERLSVASRELVVLGADSFRFGDDDERATVTVQERAAGSVTVVTMSFVPPQNALRAAFRLTRQATARGEARAVQELSVGVSEIDDAWAVEAERPFIGVIAQLKEPLECFLPFDTSITSGATVIVEVRSGTGMATFDHESVTGLGAALLTLWLRMTERRTATRELEQTQLAEQAVAARLASIEAAVAEAMALYAGVPSRVGGALEARVTLPLGVEELAAQVRVGASRAASDWDISLDGAVGPGAPHAFVRKAPGLFGDRSTRVDAPAAVRDSHAVLQLTAARVVDASVSPGRIRVHATCAPEEVAIVLRGALDLWRLLRGA